MCHISYIFDLLLLCTCTLYYTEFQSASVASQLGSQSLDPMTPTGMLLCTYCQGCTLIEDRYHTREMIIIAGGEPELCCRWHAKRESMDARVHAHVVGHVREKLTYVISKDAWRHRQGSASMKRFAGLYRSSLAVGCAGVSAVRFPIVCVLSLVAITTTHCTVHMSVAQRRVAWARATYQYHVNGTDTVGRSVGPSIDARGPVDHASVGLAHRLTPIKHFLNKVVSLSRQLRRWMW